MAEKKKMTTLNLVEALQEFISENNIQKGDGTVLIARKPG